MVFVCQQTFLCQKYGYCPFPRYIPADEYNLLRSVVEDKDERDLMQSWFICDDNAIPPVYVLQPISHQFPNFMYPGSNEARQQALKDWWDVFLRLQKVLKKAAMKALSTEAAHRYRKSGRSE